MMIQRAHWLLLLAGCIAWPQEKPVEIGVFINDANSVKAYRGWPLILRTDAVLIEEAGNPVSLGGELPAVAVFSSSGSALEWAWESVTKFEGPVTLDEDFASVRAQWVLGRDRTAALDPGVYAVQVSWGGFVSSVLEIEVADPPAAPGKPERVLLARLAGEAELLRGNAQSAVDLLNEALAEFPDEIPLLSLKASAHEAAGQLNEALATVEDALGQFFRQFPDVDHPPAALLRTQGALLRKIVESDRP